MEDLTNKSKSPDYYRELIFKNRFDKEMVNLVRSIKDRIDIKWDCVAVIDGEEGVGKTTLAIVMAYLLDDKFDLDRNIAYLPTTSEVEEKFHEIDTKQVLIIDEAIKALYKLRFMDKMQSRINTMYATERKQRKITFLCIPRFTDLNEFFRNDRIQFWIHVVDRGLAVAFVKDKVNIFGSDRWHMKEEYKKICLATHKKRFSEMGTEEAVKIYEKSQHFWFAFRFPELPEEVEDRYLELREQYHIKTRTVIGNDRTDITKRLLLAKEAWNLKLDNEQIARIAGVTIRSIDRIKSEIRNTRKLEEAAKTL